MEVVYGEVQRQEFSCSIYQPTGSMSELQAQCPAEEASRCQRSAQLTRLRILSWREAPLRCGGRVLAK